MASPWDRLAQAASVMQLTGGDAFTLVSMIAQAAYTARRNRDLCQQLAQHVLMVGDLLQKVDIPELRRHPETRRPLDQLDAILRQTYDLVCSCTQQQQNTSPLYQILTGADVASKLRRAQEQIDRYTNLIPMITLAGVINSRQGREEGDEDVNNDAASNRRARLSLQDFANSLVLEEMPPGEMVGSREENPHVAVMENVTDSMRHVLIAETQLSEVRDQIFSFNELSLSTHGFSYKSKLGNGCFYRGFLQDNGLHVAIKRITTRNDMRVIKSAHMRILDQLKHRNLVQFYGWSSSKDGVSLVYELLENGSLDTHLNSSKNSLTWAIRYKIILGMGDALLYLHKNTVLHGNIKPSNVMLDSSFNAKLGDFELSDRIYHRSYCDMGYYHDPINVGTTTADVYSFGVNILEITCGRRPWDSMPRPKPKGQEESSDEVVRLVPWVRGWYGRRAILDAADPRLDGELEAREMMERALVVGLWCTHPRSESRPSIRQAMCVIRHPEEPPPLLLLTQAGQP